MTSCINCGHEVKKNYYGGWIHAQQWMGYCNVMIEKPPILRNTLSYSEQECGCTKPIGGNNEESTR